MAGQLRARRQNSSDFHYSVDFTFPEDQMTKQPDAKPEFVVCINSGGYPASLELHKIYRVLPDEDAAADGDIRVIDESGEDYLYPASQFAPISVSQVVKDSLLKIS